MAGKVAATNKDVQYRNYWCSRATKSRALCAHYNGHSASRLETAVLEYLGQFSDPETVKRHIEAADREEMSTRVSELKDVEAGLADLDTQFTQNLGFLRRGVLNEQEFVKANNMAVTKCLGCKSEGNRWLSGSMNRRTACRPGIGCRA